MKTVQEWFDDYGICHQNPTNKLIHWVAIPAIIFSLLGLLWKIPVPEIIETSAFLNWATLISMAALGFYGRLSVSLLLGMALFLFGMLCLVFTVYQTGAPMFQLCIAIFVVAWIFQFIGHQIEGKKPSFFTDLQYLLIGPLWLMGFIYRRLGIGY
jgi:uncharacterized membrane protein YGL010W